MQLRSCDSRTAQDLKYLSKVSRSSTEVNLLQFVYLWREQEADRNDDDDISKAESVVLYIKVWM